MTLMAALTAASTAISVLGSVQQGKAAKASANYNAQVQQNNAALATQNATLAGRAGAANAEREQMKARANVGAIKASQAANGVNVNTGSAVDVRSGAAEAGLLNAITVRSNAAKEAYGNQTQATSANAQAQLDRAQGKSAETAGYVNAAGTLLGQTTKGINQGNYDDLINSKSVNSDSFYGPSTLPWQNEPGYTVPNY